MHNSDSDHWQSHFERSKPEEFVRINQQNWDEPDCDAWIHTIEDGLGKRNHSELILIGHSIGCMAIVKWFEKFNHPIKGALLVAPSDSERENYPTYITGFVPIPTSKLPFPSIVVASTNDHVADINRSKEFAKNWGSELITLEDAGHIEPKSGFGEWPYGMELIRRLEEHPTNNK